MVICIVISSVSVKGKQLRKKNGYSNMLKVPELCLKEGYNNC